MLLDKTGTITLGHPELDRVVAADGFPADETLRLAASLDQLSSHPLAKALVAGAEARNLALTIPEQVEEEFGRGVRGTVDGHRVLVGSAGWLRDARHRAAATGRARRGRREGARRDRRRARRCRRSIGDRLRDDSADLVPRLRDVGIRHVALVTGDKASVADVVGETLGVDRVYAEQTPDQKLEVVRALRARPICAASSWSATASTTPPRSRSPTSASRWARPARPSPRRPPTPSSSSIASTASPTRSGSGAARSTSPARASSPASALSLVAMGFAAAGYLPPVQGALLQEVIDVAVILNALRALTD